MKRDTSELAPTGADTARGNRQTYARKETCVQAVKRIKKEASDTKSNPLANKQTNKQNKKSFYSWISNGDESISLAIPAGVSPS